MGFYGPTWPGMEHSPTAGQANQNQTVLWPIFLLDFALGMATIGQQILRLAVDGAIQGAVTLARQRGKLLS